MGLTMKNFNVMGVHWKMKFLGGFTKIQYNGKNCLKRGLDSLRGAWQKRECSIFEEDGDVDTPMPTMKWYCQLQKWYYLKRYSETTSKFLRRNDRRKACWACKCLLPKSSIYFRNFFLISKIMFYLPMGVFLK